MKIFVYKIIYLRKLQVYICIYVCNGTSLSQNVIQEKCEGIGFNL